MRKQARRGEITPPSVAASKQQGHHVDSGSRAPEPEYKTSYYGLHTTEWLNKPLMKPAE